MLELAPTSATRSAVCPRCTRTHQVPAMLESAIWDVCLDCMEAESQGHATAVKERAWRDQFYARLRDGGGNTRGILTSDVQEAMWAGDDPIHAADRLLLVYAKPGAFPAKVG